MIVMNTDVQAGVLIYDAECPLCRLAAAWVERSALPGTIELLACQAPGRESRFPELPEARCLEAMHFAVPGEGMLRGADALPAILRRIRRWQWLARILNWPLVRGIAPGIYRWVARNRYTLSIIVAHRGLDKGSACGNQNKRRE